MRTVWKASALGLLAAIVLAPNAAAQRPSAAESGLVGIKLFDTGMRLLSVYGQPDDIQPLGGGAAAPAASGGFNGGQAGPAGGAPGFRGPIGRSGGGSGGSGGGKPGGPVGGQADVRDPFGFSDDFLQLAPSGPGNQGRSGPAGGMGYPTGYPGGPGSSIPVGAPSNMPTPGAGVPPSFGPGTAPSFGGSNTGAPSGPSYSGSSQGYTRWIYKRGGGKYGFIMDSKSRIIQIEAIGLEDKRVRTRKGLSFGASFIKVIKTYGWPDSYEVAGNSITMRYLLKNKVVFRLNRLGQDKPHVVTGVLIAAAKS